MPALAMPDAPSEQQLRQWKTLFEHLTGLQLANHRDSLVRAVIERRLVATGYTSVAEYLHNLQDVPAFSRREWDVLIEQVVIGETRFFRYGATFSHIGRYLAEKVRSGRQLNKITAWSVGCSTGEEAYSLAMLMHRICSAGRQYVPYSVVGTDINGGSLKLAAQGVYRDVLKRGIDETMATMFFDFLGNGRYRIKRFVGSKVAFFRHNMLEPVASALIPPMDVISCQNVLMYLQPWRRRAVIRHLVSFLKPDGILVLCSGDLSGWKPDNLERVADPDVLVYRRVY